MNSPTGNHGPVQQALRLSLLDGALYAVMVGCSESYLGVLAVELGHQSTALALLATVPLALGALAQVASGALGRLLGSRKRLVLLFVSVQALTHAGFAWVAFTSHTGLWAFLTFKCLFWVSGMIVGPAWAAWMGSLTDGPRRERYFAVRSGLVQGVLLISFWGAGELLQLGRESNRILQVAALLMLLALVARMGGVLVLGLQADPYGKTPTPPAAGHLRRALTSPGWRVAGYVALLGFGAYIAVPFFTPYMLRELGLEVREFTLLSAVSILCKALIFPLGHRISARIGLRSILGWGGLGVAAIPLLWALEPSFEQLLWIHALGGFSWAAVEYASFQLLLSNSDSRVAVDFLALASALQGALQLGGGVLGGVLLDRTSLGYTEVFLLSAGGRALPLLLLITLPVSPLRRLPHLAFRLLGVVPVVGPRFRPLLPEQKDTQNPDADAAADAGGSR